MTCGQPTRFPFGFTPLNLDPAVLRRALMNMNQMAGYLADEVGEWILAAQLDAELTAGGTANATTVAGDTIEVKDGSLADDQTLAVDRWVVAIYSETDAVWYAFGIPEIEGGAGEEWNWRGPWDIATEYHKNDVVGSAGSCYIALDTSTGSEPPSAHWGLVAQKGAQGDQGPPGDQGPEGPEGPQGPPGEDGATLLWGKVYGEPTNQSSVTSLAVEVKACDKDGNNVTGDPFYVYTPVDATGRTYTYVFEDDVVGYLTDDDDVPVIVTQCLDDPFGTPKPWGEADVPKGWSEMSVGGRFPIGVEAETDWDDVEDQGGDNIHTHDNHLGSDIANVLEPAGGHMHTLDTGSSVSAGVAIGADTTSVGDHSHGGSAVNEVSHSWADHKPQWFAMRWIIRRT